MTGRYELSTGTIQESLLKRKIKDSVAQVIVYMEINNELSLVHINPEGLTTTAAILEAVQKFNMKYKFGLVDQAQMYQLYAAKKNGKKQNDLPAMENQQLITKTKIKKFHLQYLGKMPQGQETKQSISVIKSDFNIDVRNKNTNDTKVRIDENEGGFFSCFCIHRQK